MTPQLTCRASIPTSGAKQSLLSQERAFQKMGRKSNPDLRIPCIRVLDCLAAMVSASSTILKGTRTSFFATAFDLNAKLFNGLAA
jgi:hypothetical protein